MSRRDEILQIAKVQFARDGYRQTSMREIAEASGLLAGSLYSHFHSKAELVRDIVLEFYQELTVKQQQVLDGLGTGAERFELMLADVFSLCARHRDELTILHYDWQVLSSLEELSDVRTTSIKTLDLWRRVLEAGRFDGSIDSSVDTDAVVRIITSSIHALLDTVRYADRPLPFDKVLELGVMLSHILSNGIVVNLESSSVIDAGRSSQSDSAVLAKTSSDD